MIIILDQHGSRDVRDKFAYDLKKRGIFVINKCAPNTREAITRLRIEGFELLTPPVEKMDRSDEPQAKVTPEEVQAVLDSYTPPSLASKIPPDAMERIKEESRPKRPYTLKEAGKIFDDRIKELGILKSAMAKDLKVSTSMIYDLGKGLPSSDVYYDAMEYYLDMPPTFPRGSCAKQKQTPRARIRHPGYRDPARFEAPMPRLGAATPSAPMPSSAPPAPSAVHASHFIPPMKTEGVPLKPTWARPQFMMLLELCREHMAEIGIFEVSLTAGPDGGVHVIGFPRPKPGLPVTTVTTPPLGKSNQN